MQRNARRSQPVQAMKTTPFRPACQQSPVTTSPPKPQRHSHSPSTCGSGSPVPSLLSGEQHQPRGPRLHPLWLLHSHLAEPNLAAPPPRAIPGRYPVGTRLRFLPTSRPGSAHRARGARPAAPPPGPPAPRVAASCAPPLLRRGGGAWTRASAAAWPIGARLTLASPPRGRQSRRAVVVILWSGVWMPPLPRAGAARRRGLPGYFGKGV